MVKEVYKIKIYADEIGKEPFTEWLDSLENVDQARIDSRLTRVISGNLGDYKHLEDKLYELRFKNNSGFRIYYSFDGDTIMILFNGGNKGSQKKDIEKAKYYLTDHEKRKTGV